MTLIEFLTSTDTIFFPILWIGEAINAAHDARMYEKRRKDDKDITHSARMWDLEMSNTAHQREVKDLQAAGLNPNLSAGGPGASTPSSPAPSSPDAQPLNMPSIVDIAGIKQNQERIDIDRQNSAAAIAKNLDERELLKMKKVLLQKGMPRAQLEGEAATFIDKALKYLKKQNDNSNHPQGAESTQIKLEPQW